MKRLSYLLCVTAAMLAQNAAAAIIYQDSLIGTGGVLNGTTVDASTGLYGGTLDAAWIASTDVTETTLGADYVGGKVALLPITIQEGVVYTLTATLERTSSDGTNWTGLGFSSANSVFTGNKYAWALVRNANANGAPQFFAGSGTANQVSAPSWTGALDGQQTVSITLDTTTAGAWKTQATIGGISSSVYTYSNSLSNANNFKYIAFGGYNGGTNLVKSLSLTASPVPEPGAGSLLLPGVAWSLRSRKRRK